MSVDLFSDNLDGLRNEELFAAILALAKAQPSEGWRLDYTEMWDDLSSLKNIAAFANAFGGLMIVGVKKDKRDSECVLIGVESAVEYKTRIASAIAGNISPTPAYSVFECFHPSIPNRRFCVIRVREGRGLHLISRKDVSNPIYVRNEDESKPADALQIRRLIDKEKIGPDTRKRITDRANELRSAVHVRCNYENKESAEWYLSAHHGSPTSLKLEMIPTDTFNIEIEKSHEEKLVDLIGSLYARTKQTVLEGQARQAESRKCDYYEYVWYHKKLNYEIRWAITGAGETAFATQMDYRSEGFENVWSVVDLALYIILFVKLNLKWWASIGYFGEATLFAHLALDNLKVLRHPEHGYYIQGFDPTYVPRPRMNRREIRKDAIQLSASAGNGANAEARLTYFSGEQHLARITTTLLNQLLRSLNHAVDWNLVRSSIELMIED